MRGTLIQASGTKYRLTPDERAGADANLRQLHAAELAVLALLLRHRDEVVARGRQLGFPPGLIAAQLASALYAAMMEARRLSRAYGLARLRAELARLGLSLELPPDPIAFPTDSLRASIVSRSYATRWQKAADQASRKDRVAALLHDDEDEREPTDVLAIAAAATLGSIERIAATENAQAFTAARDAALAGRLDRELAKVWDSTLDRKTCPICREADGTIVGLAERFPLGVPGDVHPFCRCDYSIVRIEYPL